MMELWAEVTRSLWLAAAAMVILDCVLYIVFEIFFAVVRAREDAE